MKPHSNLCVCYDAVVFHANISEYLIQFAIYTQCNSALYSSHCYSNQYSSMPTQFLKSGYLYPLPLEKVGTCLKTWVHCTKQKQLMEILF